MSSLSDGRINHLRGDVVDANLTRQLEIDLECALTELLELRAKVREYLTCHDQRVTLVRELRELVREELTRE